MDFLPYRQEQKVFFILIKCASNPLWTQDNIDATLVENYGISVFAIKGEDPDTYHYSHIQKVLETKPNILTDDWNYLVTEITKNKPELIDGIIRTRNPSS